MARYAPNGANRQVARWVVVSEVRAGTPPRTSRPSPGDDGPVAELYATRVRPLVHQRW